ncbi:MAG: lipopolysaccharide biosynthesis protein [Rhodocyclaceae bacterium]|nr:lipopolysaccharide biosynthesis protein [Rhodocyclaceae bacterium]
MSEEIQPGGATIDDDSELSLLDLLLVVAKHKRLVFRFTAVAAVGAIVISLLLPNIYTGTTKILPPQQSSSAAAAMLSASLAGGAGGLSGIKNPADTYIGMLKSRTVADNLIQRFNLAGVYGSEYQSTTRKTLASVTSITSGKDGILTIEVDDKEPQRAADLANAYVEELLKLTTVLAITDAAQRRLFYERQLEQAREKLRLAENAAKQAIDRGGLSNVEAQGRAALELIARFRGQIAVKEVQISSMKQFAAAQNPNLKMAEQELAAMKQELAKIDGSHTGADGEGSDNEGFSSLRLVRNVKYSEAVFEALAKQYELAKLDEAKESSVVQVMDVAVVPDRKSKPKRSIIVILATIAGFLLGLVAVFVREAIDRSKSEPEQAARLHKLREYLLPKK